jgi:drug/metabolite transporter (DMT)-like permease
VAAVSFAIAERSPRLGYALAATAATLWAVNSSLARFLLDDGVSALHLAQLRSTVTWLLLAGILLAVAPRTLRIRREDVPRMAWFGIAGLAGVHATYFLAIDRIDIGVALTIQYLGPLLILLWLRFGHGRRLRPSMWAAVALAAAGCFLVVEAYDVRRLDVAGLVPAFGAAFAFATYIVAAERAGHRYTAPTTLAWAAGFATLFWLVARPPWTFPWHDFAAPSHLALGLGVAIIGTLVPFLLMVIAVRHIPGLRAAVVATLEPVLGALIAWPVHGQDLSGPQLTGAVVVIAAVLWVQMHRPEQHAEGAPAYGS